MDRNVFGFGAKLVHSVALRKESVDRNLLELSPWGAGGASLSARRAWIEINKKGRTRRPGQVALRKESVDRNLAVWAIEHGYQVALRKESVDRNLWPAGFGQNPVKSLSARRAWIEIPTLC